MDFGQKRPAPAPAAIGAPAGTADVIKDATTASFAKDVIEASRTVPVIVDFWAPWCGPCKQLTPVIEKVVKAQGGKVRLVKINIDEHPAIAGQLRVQSIPMVYAFKDGRPVDGFQGAQPESAVKQFVEGLVGADDGAPDLEHALAEAAKVFDAGDVQTAAEIYAAVIEEDRANVAALAGLAKCYLKTGDLEKAEQTLSLVPPDKQTNQAVASVKAAIDLAKLGQKNGGDTAGLKAKVLGNPADHQARIDLAVALAAAGDNAGAVTELLESFRRDRNWNEQAARKQLVQLFEAWGPKDAATLDGRRRLSSLMFS